MRRNCSRQHPCKVVDHEIEESSNLGVRERYWCTKNVSIGHTSTNLSTRMQRVHALLRAGVRAGTYVRICAGWHVAALCQISYMSSDALKDDHDDEYTDYDYCDVDYYLL